MNYRHASICDRFDADTLPNVATCHPAVVVDDDDDDSAEDDAVDGLTQQVCSSAPAVDLLRALPASCTTAIMSVDDVISPPPPTSTRTLMLSPRLAACCRTCDVQRRWNARAATAPVASDAACTCAGWVSAKPAQHSPSPPLPAPPPIPRRSRTLLTDRRRRIDDAYFTYTSGNVDFADVELAASLPTRHFDCFRFCCFRSSRSRRTTRTNDVVGLTTVCRCSAVVDTGSGNRNSHHDELNSNKRRRGGRRRHMAHVLIACIVALPVTCLLLVGLCLVLSPLYQSPTGTSLVRTYKHHFDTALLIISA